MSKTCSVLLSAALCASGTATAFAQDQEEGVVELSADTNEGVAAEAEADVGSPAGPRGPLSLYGGLRLGFGGEVSIENDDTGAEGEDDLLATIGLQLGADYVVWDYVAVGGELRLGWVNTDGRDDGDIGRDTFIDIAVKPRGRYAFDNLPLEVYGTLPLGITFIATNGDVEDKGGVELSQGPGFNLGIGAGATYFFTDHMGVNGEMAYLMYWWGSEAEVLGATAENSNYAGQFNLFANFVYAL
jgi:hypothetical protein